MWSGGRWGSWGERRPPSAHSFPTPEPLSGLQTRLSTCWFLRSWAGCSLLSYPAVPDASSSSMCCGVGTFGVHCSLQRPLTSSLRCGHWGGGDEGTRGQMEVEGRVVVALRLQRLPWAEFRFVLDLTPQSSHSDSPRSCFSVLHWFPLRVAGSVTVSSFPLSSSWTYKHATGIRTVSVRHLHLSSFKLF